MLRRLRNILAVAIIAISPVITLLTPVAVHALPGSYCLWTGTFNGDWNDEANWTSVSSGCTGTSVNNSGVAATDPNTVPANGNNLVFDTSASANDPVNNLVGLSVASISFTGTGGSSIPVTGNSLTLTGNVSDDSDQSNSIENDIAVGGTHTIDVVDPASIDFLGTVSGAGSIIKTGSGTIVFQSMTLTGTLTANGGRLGVIATSSADATFSEVSGVASGATFAYDAFSSSSVTTYTLSKPITTTGTGTLDFGGGTPGTPQTLNLTGAITIGGNTEVKASDGTTVHVKGALHGPGFKLTNSSSGVVLNESTDNTTSTPTGNINSTSTTPTATPGAPDTGFALVSAHPGVTLAITLAASAGILGVGRLTRNAATRR